MRKILNRKTKKNPNFIFHVVIGVFTCLMLVVIIQWDKGLFKAEFHEGDIALRAIYAPYDFNVKGEINTKLTDAAIKKATDSILPVYIYDPETKNALIGKIESIVRSVLALRDPAVTTAEEKAAKIKEIASSYNISDVLISDISQLSDIDAFLNHARKAVEILMAYAVVSDEEYSRLKAGGIKTVQLMDKSTGETKIISADELLTLEDLKNKAESFSFALVKNKKERGFLLDLIKSVLNLNTVYGKEKTESEKRASAQKVQPIYMTIEVKKNETILNKGERIGKEHIAILMALSQNENPAVKVGGMAAVIILVGLFMLLVTLYIKFYESGIMKGNKELILLALISILMLFIAKIIVVSPWPSSLIPVAVASMLIAILINSRLAIVTTCFLSIMIGIISGNRMDIAGVSLVGGIISVFAIQGVRRRSQVIAAGLCVGFANISYLIGMGLIRGLDFHTYITEALFGLTNGVMSAVIVTGILPVFENAFKITTDISLLELADLNHPLLKEMVIKAPGTYHHSLVVGNLAEAACEAIGANALLARVSSYFHDIGKIEKAFYFSENQPRGESAHDKLLPTMSRLIITNHVKNGIELAEKHNLNRKIIDIINQHHGTGLVFYFFKRALEKGQDEKADEQSFRYPGPKPQTKEAACVLLADSVEAGSRALEDPTPSRIKGLVKKIINNKFIDGQLDECDLTLKDLEKIAEVFTHILTGIFHTRVEYPEEPHNSNT
ncbi:MAG: HDIG domain-containing protein [Candidatus Omnitrophica bacterium]|nr:HDIG domain-containing protein [Candidatus Omnitrophota bacterium]